MPEPLPVFDEPTTYESLPVKIRAIQWDGTAAHAGVILRWIHGAGHNATYACDPATTVCTGLREAHVLAIHTLEGVMTADAGWWIIQGTEGEFYPCKDSVFQHKYRKVASAPSPEIKITVGPTPGDVAMMITKQALSRNLRTLARG